MVGSIACADMLFRTNLIAMVGGGTAPRFDEKAGAVSYGQLSKNILRKIAIIFLSISLNMCYGYSKELSH